MRRTWRNVNTASQAEIAALTWLGTGPGAKPRPRALPLAPRPGAAASLGYLVYPGLGGANWAAFHGRYSTISDNGHH